MSESLEDEYEEVEEEEEEEEDDEEFEEFEDEEEEETDEEDGSEEREEDEEDMEDQLKSDELNLRFLNTDDAASCMAVGARFLAIGTQRGWLHVVDFVGTVIKEYQNHHAPLTDISIDDNCDFVGACSTDGWVSVSSIYTGHISFGEMFDRPVKAIAIDPNYKEKNRFVTGGLEKKLILVDKSTFLKRWQNTTLYTETGRIHAIKWHKNLIAWADDGGIKVYDVVAKTKIVKVERERNAPVADLYRCNLIWEHDNSLLIAWGDWLVMCVIKQRPAYEKVQDPQLPDRCGEVTSKYVMPNYFVCGIAPFGVKKLLMLTYPDDTLKRKPGQPAPKPVLRILNRSDKMNEIQKNSLDLAGYDTLLASDYQLAFDESEEGDEKVYYVLSPRQIVVFMPCNTDDRINWLLKRKKFEEAIRVVKAQKQYVVNHTWQTVGEKYLDHLVDQKQYTKAAGLMREFLGTDGKLWKKWICVFREKEQLAAIVDSVPVDRHLNLGSEVYEMILHYFLWKTEISGAQSFYKAVKEWPPDLYNRGPIINSTRQRLEELEKPEILDPPATAGTTLKEAVVPKHTTDDHYSLISVALAHLYEQQGQRENALKIHLELGRSDVFDFIDRHGLHHAVEKNVVPLLWKNMPRALNMLVKHHSVIKVSDVVPQLKSRPVYLYRYLDLLYKEDAHAGSEYHDRLVELYAQFAPQQLLLFLRQASLDNFQGISLDTAADVCKTRLELSNIPEEDRKELYRVQAYVWGRLGERRRALEILISKIKSVKESIDFIVEHDDEDLFETLVQACLDGGQEFVADLLEHIGDAEGPTKAIEPLDVINRIRPDMEIPGLKQKLTRIMRDQALRAYLKEGCLKVLQKDLADLGATLVHNHQRAVNVDVTKANPCPICDRPLRLVSQRPQGVVVFLCKHTYHASCYLKAVGKPAVAAVKDTTKPRVKRKNGVVVRIKEHSTESFLPDQRPRCPVCAHARKKAQ
ncbi:Vacuolar protein sorting-associated protein 41-like protein [Diplonema papillatum]|nr:Vacuolar protein sorting-associated protein 41-like protein [Diplonema papillatum]